MAGKQASSSLNEALQASRKERNAKLAQEMLGHDPKKLAQEMLGKNRRTNTPQPKPPNLSLSTRAGITKRSTSLPRSNTAPPRNPKQTTNLNRPPIGNSNRPRASFNATTASSDLLSDAKINGITDRPATNGGSELNIRGAAAGSPAVIRAQNFAPGTTAADIESVMSSIGGETTFCRLISSTPTVIAEMGFAERSGAERVIEMFNNKKADGRLLYVYFADGGTPAQITNGQRELTKNESLPAAVDTIGDETIMEVDENAESREAENKLREERRGVGDERGRQNDFPRGPRNDRRYNNDDYRGPRRAGPEYQDGRYGFGAGGDRYGGRRYRDDERMYRGGQSYRP